jgi:hypothetical protein
MKKVVMLILMVVAGVSAASAQNLTLKEKQAIAGLDFGWAEKRIAENYGSAVKIAVDSASFAGDMDAILYACSRGSDYAANALASLCGDKLAKEALVEKKLTKLVLVNNAKKKPSVAIANGVMTVTSGFSSDDNHFSEQGLTEAIENLL